MAKFADLKRCLRALADVPSQAAEAACEEIESIIQRDFDSGLDPYGDPWAELAPATLAKGRHPPPLTDSGDMRGGVEVRPLPGTGISVTIPDPGVHHQYGTIHMPQRAIFPNRGTLPDTWQRAIADAVEAAVDRAAESL